MPWTFGGECHFQLAQPQAWPGRLVASKRFSFPGMRINGTVGWALELYAPRVSLV